MKIEAIKDFRRPRAAVLRNFRDPERIESVLKGMGATVDLLSGPPEMLFSCAMVWREEARRFTVKAVETAPDETFTLILDSDLAKADMTFDFYDLDDGGCQVITKAELSAHTMIAKLALQSLRLVRGKAEAKLERFVVAIARK